MISRSISLMLILTVTTLSACAGPASKAPRGAAAYELFNQTAPAKKAAYRIGPFDKLSINVFLEPELSFEEIPVDSAGIIPFPLIGNVNVDGLTAREVSDQIRSRLMSGNYILDPQVTIFVANSASQKITVEGDVNLPGVFAIEGQTTLLQAMALARGPTEIADLGEIIIFRKSGEQVLAAQFDLSNIRAGLEPNPILSGEDLVVVGRSGLNKLYEDLLRVAPALTASFIRIL